MHAEWKISRKYGSNFDFWHIDNIICESHIFILGKVIVSIKEVNKAVDFDIWFVLNNFRGSSRWSLFLLTTFCFCCCSTVMKAWKKLQIVLGNASK